ncbi:MAG: hypothetical protein N2747_07915, partial [Chitinophagaceae bacterium]|nr:hypothetical protein [Chitinophagaceae bacterium]
MKNIFNILYFINFFAFLSFSKGATHEKPDYYGLKINDTTINLNHNKKDSNLIQLSAHTTDDPKEALKKFLNVALKGDEVSGVRLNPGAVSYVEKYISQHKKSYLELKQKKSHHLQLMEQILEQHGVPGEMKYLAVIES